MFLRSLLGLSLCLLVFATACQQAPPPDTHEADVKAIKDTEAAWVQAFNTRDVDRVASFYTADATVLIANEPIYKGMEAIKAGMKPMLSDPGFKVAFAAAQVEVAKSGEIGYSQGPCTVTMTDPVSKKTGDDPCKYLTVWKKQGDGTWKAVEDTFNSDTPLPPPGKK